jgi:hypothetical protein
MPDRKFLVSMPHGPPGSYASIEAVLVHACEHARNRLLHACEAITWVGGLALQWTKPHTPLFSLKGAEVQDATAGSGEQAAHVLPGQILIDGNPPWALARGDAMKVAWLARFMVTSAVPVPFNTADSAAEQAGLKEAFRLACERAWSRAAAGQRDLTPTYEAFLEDADRAFQTAEHAKRGKRAAAASKGDARASDERLVEALILRTYRVHGVTAREANRIFPLPTPAP